ncbi:MAG TPA: hypothetical protein VN282_22935 [Pyrinomonadaceae bacterium]|nr:hypothetical protein [Pyrinomonadaceae bacterium]
MSRRKLSAAVLGLLLAGASAPARQAAADTPKPSKVFQEARAVNADATPSAQSFEFEMNGFSYHVRANGNGRRTKGKKSRGFNLHLDAGEAVTNLLYSEFEGDLLLLLHTDIAGVPLGFVTRLEQPSMRGLWRQRIPAGDVGRPLRDGHDLYVTGLGLVGKLDLRTGEYAWQHDDLEVERADGSKPLHTFEEPQLDGDAVLFRERPVYNPRRTLVLDRRSGKVIRVE